MKLVAANLVALKYLLYMTVFHMLFTSIFSFRHQQKLRHIYKKTELWDWQEIRFNDVFLVREARETSLAINGLFLGATPMIVSIFYETVLLVLLLMAEISLTSGRAVLPSKLVDGRCRVQSPVEHVDLVFRNCPWFSPKLM